MNDREEFMLEYICIFKKKPYICSSDSTDSLISGLTISSLALSIIYQFNLFSIENPDAQNWNSILNLAMNLLDYIAICQITMAYNDSIRLCQAIMKHVT